jgi:8-oxo-dGTP diphosphatase
MNIYVLGFLFDAQDAEVVLIRKTHPDWAAGRLNGVGGHIENGETPEEAMAREFQEETGDWVPPTFWREFARMTSAQPEWEVVCFTAQVSGFNIKTMTDEEVRAYRVSTLSALPLVPSVGWMIPLALDRNKIAHVQKL